MGLQIPAPPFLAQIFFQTARGNGFSEGYWVDAPDYNAALGKVAEDFPNLVTLRRALFTASHYVSYVRVSDSSRKRDTVVASFTSANGGGTYVPTVGDTEVDEAAVQLRFESADATVPIFALKPLRLIPEECVTDGKLTPVAAWSTALQTLKTELIANYRLVMKSGGVPATFPIISIITQHMTRRKVGRPFGLSGGRSRRP